MSYDRIAALYDFLAALYTGGGIARAKKVHLEGLIPGQRVLYVGAGTGAECIGALRRGAEVTALDSSPRMVAQLQARFARAGLSGTARCADALGETLAGERFDVVVAPFFLNVFSPADVLRATARLRSLLFPGGSLVVVDFRAPARGWFSWLQRALYLPPLALFWLLTDNAWHELYDYPQLFQAAGLPLTLRERRVTRAFGLPLLETLTWELEE